MAWNAPVRRPHPIVILVVLALLPCLWLAAKCSGGGRATQAAPPSDAEARVNVLALCDAVQAYRDEHGVCNACGAMRGARSMYLDR